MLRVKVVAVALALSAIPVVTFVPNGLATSAVATCGSPSNPFTRHWGYHKFSYAGSSGPYGYHYGYHYGCNGPTGHVDKLDYHQGAKK